MTMCFIHRIIFGLVWRRERNRFFIKTQAGNPNPSYVLVFELCKNESLCPANGLININRLGESFFSFLKRYIFIAKTLMWEKHARSHYTTQMKNSTVLLMTWTRQDSNTAVQNEYEMLPGRYLVLNLFFHVMVCSAFILFPLRYRRVKH